MCGESVQLDLGMLFSASGGVPDHQPRQFRDTLCFDICSNRFLDLKFEGILQL